MRNILIPTDFSDNAMNAIKFALELFKYDKSNIYFLHTYQDEVYREIELQKSDHIETIIKDRQNHADDHLNQLLQTVNKVWANPRHQYHKISSYNALVDEIDLISEGKDIDIVVMGTKGQTDDRSATFGSNTLQVLKYVSCPVLSIPANYTYTQPKHIAFPTNYLIPYKRRELKLLCEMASPYRAIIDILYISSSDKLSRRQDDNKRFLSEELCKNKLNFKTIASKSIVNAIFTYIKEHEVDMLVMVNTRHSFLEDILFKSTIDEMSLHLDIPFLAMQNIKRTSA
ncbi:universal stress protein [Psychroserpens sp.]|uniref:universal stress protein n=1 Tax=Psychroserpens sp. TaxID=2020870 RepID=UPI001B0EA9D6|nr:universal stress protein [Psychroserpens sp.]MBO6607501.1 universal stress protein [Psychroserpens sp.]MBO6654421.1 universal stress protein [Psychroserpens sp.]MBO6681230.1 universal stress protein [Psychroserpens sp.]MBO6749813.1 universal stress protein [Psychroserpens sp.]MBO6916199.1 universal stress protein [Psychroserpens sp.]